MRRTVLVFVVSFVATPAIVAQTPADRYVPKLRHVGSEKATGTSQAVLVPDVPLVHTAQLLPVDAAGKLAAPGDAAGQVDQVLDRLDSVLRKAGTRLDDTVRLNIYVAREEVAAVVFAKLAARFATEHRPTVSLVETALPDRAALVAVDAVAAVMSGNTLSDAQQGPSSAVLPAGSRLYVSGQAEPGSLREATRKTLESLTATLNHCGRSDRDVVQFKCFFQPMEQAAQVRDEIVRYYGAERTPPVSFVEWRSNSPIEIELIAAGGPAQLDAQEPLEFLTPPALKASPLFSRVARINRGGTIYFSDLSASEAATAEDQVKVPFEDLRRWLEKAGSDFKHLAKATYYVTDDDVSQALNAIRPRYYDPARPPAASKALVAETGRRGARYSMDLIAVPSSRGTPTSGPEYGFGLTAAEAAAGWISLFDGKTTFGWKDARVEDDTLRGGATTTRLGNCELQGKFSGAGKIVVGQREYSVGPDKPLLIGETNGTGQIRLGEGVAVQSLAVRPLGLKSLVGGPGLAGWKTIERKGSTDAPSSFWRMDDGKLRAVGGPGAIEYAGGEFGDVVLQLDVRSRSVHSNGGVFIRAIPADFMNGYEIQLHNRCLEDDPARPFRYTTGGIDDRQDARRLVGRDFEPFRLTIVADGPHLASWVNGVQVADWTDDRPLDDNPRQGQRLRPGALQLQAHDPATDYEISAILAAELK